MQSAKLPIGIQSFETIRTEGYIYIEKTPYIARMALQGGPFSQTGPGGPKSLRMLYNEWRYLVVSSTLSLRDVTTTSYTRGLHEI
jgi:hypothetical protein